MLPSGLRQPPREDKQLTGEAQVSAHGGALEGSSCAPTEPYTTVGVTNALHLNTASLRISGPQSS